MNCTALTYYVTLMAKRMCASMHQSTDVLNNRKLFWKYIKSKRKDSVGISIL